MEESYRDYLKQLKTWIRENREFDIIELFTRIHPSDIADLIDLLEEDEKVHLFSLLDVETASEVILEISDLSREQILEEISDEKLTEIVEEMDSDDAADFIADLPEDQAQTVLEGFEPEDVEDVRKLLGYEEDTAGGIMQSELVAVREDALVRDAIQSVIRHAEENDNIYDVFVVDEDNRLIGAVPLQKLITSKRTGPISESIDRDIPSVTVDVDQEQVARMFKKYDLVSLPVVDHERRLVGRITVDDVVDVIEEETSEDIYRISGVSGDDSALSGPFQSVLKRLPWLYLNLLTAAIAASVIAHFEDTIQIAVMIVVFLPMIAGLGGNAGGQVLALMVRGMALGELTFDNARKILLKEILVGLMNGIAVGAVIGFIGYLWKGIPMLGVVVFLAMMINVLVGTFAGTLIPFTLKWLKLDPALGSNIFITGLTDTFGFLSLLGLATIFIKLLVP
ncbi:MAG: magnesium transporter [Smithellaceae bacterium]|nr:magnesium transporter [Smithellaceae bacterium]